MKIHRCEIMNNCCNKYIIGPIGTQGIQGITGATGSSGTAVLGAYACIYNTAAQVVAVEADVTFSNNGVIVGSITHAPATTSINLDSAGDYSIWFIASCVEPTQFTLFLNGDTVVGTTYGSGAGNHTSSAAVTLQTVAGGTQTNVNASILIQRIR